MRLAAAWGLLLLASCGSCRTALEPRHETSSADARADGRDGPPRPDHAWFVQQRMSAGRPIPARARERALAAARRRHPAHAVAEAPGSWVFAGPANIGGRLTALAVDPDDVDHLWTGTAAGGVMESVDGGATWQPVFDGQPLLPIGALAIDDAGTLYAGTGEANGAGYSYDGDGVYRSADGGLTWQPLGLAETRRIGRIAIDPSDAQRIFVAASGNVYEPGLHRGLYRSTDGGQSWEQVLYVAPTAGAIDVAIDPVDPQRLYAAMWDHHSTATQWFAGGVSSGIWRSTDGGDTWSRLSNGLPPVSPSVGRIGLALAPTSPQTIYALYLNDPGALIGVYKTTDGGSSWARIDAPGELQLPFKGFGYYFGQIRVDPADAGRVWVLDVYMARSIDGGVTWSNIISGIHQDHHDLVILPDRLYVANDAGFYRSGDGGTTWIHSVSLPVSQFYDLAISQSNPLVRFGGLQDCGSVRTKTGGLADWTTVHGGDGMQCEIDPTDNRRVYCEAAFGALKRSTNGGNTFSDAVTGITPTDRRNWSPPITHDPHAAQRLYTATFRVYRSIDGAGTWAPISGDLTGGPPPHATGEGSPPQGNSHLANVVEGTITTFAVSPLDTRVLWAGTDDGHVWVTADEGTQWSPVDVPGRSEWITRIEADPFLAAGAFVTFSGYRDGSPLPRIFRTTDSGSTWTGISSDLPDLPLNCVNADPDPVSRGRLFVCTDVGVSVTDDYGGSWSRLGTGLPPVVVHDLDLVTATRQLFAGTHGRSMYSYDLSQLGPADADGDGADNASDCAASDPGAFALPGEVVGLDVAAGGTIHWDSAVPSAGASTVHQLLRGSLSGLPVGSQPEICLNPGTPLTSSADAAAPSPGGGFWYLVRGANACGAGSYGVSSGGQGRVSSACAWP